MNLFGEPELGVDYIYHTYPSNKKHRYYAGICSFCQKPGFFHRRHKQTQKHHYCDRVCRGKHMSIIRTGPNNPRWKGGIKSEFDRVRDTEEYAEWRRQVFMQDDYTCQECGDKNGGNLEAHHLIPICINIDLAYVVDNGLTMCIACHNEIRGHELEYLEEYLIRKGLNNEETRTLVSYSGGQLG